MKQFILIIVLCALFSGTFADSIISGRWCFSKELYFNYFLFYKSNRFINVYWYSEMGNIPLVKKGKYSISNNTLIFFYSKTEVSTNIYTMSSNLLTLTCSNSVTSYSKIVSASFAPNITSTSAPTVSISYSSSSISYSSSSTSSIAADTANSGMVWVNGYYRKNGTYVKGYWRRK